MSPRAFVDRMFESNPALRTFRQKGAVITCPLGCGPVPVYDGGVPNLPPTFFVARHKQSHKNSVQCYWSGKELLALQGLYGVDVTLRKE